VIHYFVDVVERWSERIAQRVAPDEADFAVEVGKAFAAGGKARKALLPRHNVQPGAFGPGAAGVDLPLVLQALADSGRELLALLRSPYLANALAAGSLFAALRQGRQARAAQPGEAAGKGAAGEPGEAPPASERQAMELAFESLRGRLLSAGFGQDRAGQLAYDLLEELLTDAADAALFVDALVAVPDGEARRARGSRRGAAGKGQ
jgi:hypothetical protein